MRPDDLLTTLLAVEYPDGSRMPLRQVRDEVMALLVAGHETTANTLSWSWYLLAQHRQVMSDLQMELDRVLSGQTARDGRCGVLALYHYGGPGIDATLSLRVVNQPACAWR